MRPDFAMLGKKVALFALLLSLSGAGRAVNVAPADPAAMFRGDGTAVTFDPSCRDYDVETVQSNPECAARVANGEVAPSLAIAAITIGKKPNRSAEAIRILQRSVQVSDSPATHYLLGSVLGTAQNIRPNYRVAVEHLSIAADRGNPAAADLLATLLIEGKGAPRDVPRAIRLYETAAAEGWPTAAVSLGKMYLAGKFVARDVPRGQAWLDAAAAVDAKGAAQLAALARNQDKISNVQLIPSPDPAKVRTVRFGSFDNPDIPPSFGFDPAFQTVHDAPYSDDAILARLEREANSLPTPYLYELARRLAERDPDAGLRTYVLARTRLAYDAARCADPAAMEALSAWDLVIARDLRFLFASLNGTLPRTLVDAALAEESRLPADTQPWWVCRAGMAAMSTALAGKAGPLQLKPASDWRALRDAVRARIAALAAN